MKCIFPRCCYQSAVEKLLLIGVFVLVPNVELIHSAIEAVVDRVSLERNLLSKNVRDVGSAAVLLALLFAAATWLPVLWPLFFTTEPKNVPMRIFQIDSIRFNRDRSVSRKWSALLLLCLCFIIPCTTTYAFEDRQQTRAPVMLANVYHPGIVLADYWVSEKYDGMRAYWDGTRLLTRGGEIIRAPAWFVQGWPETALDGELWTGRGRFSATVSTARRQTADDTAWRKMRFMVFDLPAHTGTFDQRLPDLRAIVAQLGLPWVQAVEQIKIADHQTLQKRLHEITQEGAEGLMLHRGASLYRAERNDDLLKFKLHEDAEARVIAHLPGKGKHAGRLGALLVETASGLRFKLGTGFSDAQRDTPPAVGIWVTYRYRGLNDSGIPRFASFLRVREDMQSSLK